MAIVRSRPAHNYPVEANVRIGVDDSSKQAGVVSYYEDPGNWLVVTLDRETGIVFR